MVSSNFVVVGAVSQKQVEMTTCHASIRQGVVEMAITSLLRLKRFTSQTLQRL
uniref:Uncharacterized protein n=1 Tax=Anguilla anguilla TaxID=7936 RepID=A0A0E9WZM2_ANGAN